VKDYTTPRIRSEEAMKRSFIILILLAAACRKHETPATVSVPPPMSSMPEMAGMSSMQPPPAPNAPVRTVAQLVNPAAATVYAQAAQITDRLSKMYCYCECHELHGHASLLTCFQTNHAEECSVCLHEATQAYMDWKNGLPVQASQHAADVAFHRGSPPPSLPQ
jgi:hypothetical protein